MKMLYCQAGEEPQVIVKDPTPEMLEDVYNEEATLIRFNVIDGINLTDGNFEKALVDFYEATNMPEGDDAGTYEIVSWTAVDTVPA